MNYVSLDSSAESKDVTSFFSRKFGAFCEALVPSPEDRHTAARQERGIKSVLEVNLRKSGAEHSIKRVLGVTW